MSRYRRPYCQGVAFHITTRVTWKVHLFDEEVRPRVLDAIAESATRSDAQLLALAIMRNHLHLVVRQGEDPLFRLMQPALRRIALAVQRRHNLEGHVFERAYRSRPCLSARHLRDSIVYTHLNPVRAGICADVNDPVETSHRCYVGDTYIVDALANTVTPALDLFSMNAGQSLSEQREDYRRYVQYRVACDNAKALGATPPERQPLTTAGDQYFGANFCVEVDTRADAALKRMDMRDIAREITKNVCPDVEMRVLRGTRVRSRMLQKVREAIIRRASEEGHSGVAIAAFFAMSPSRVSVLSRRSA